MLRILFNFFKCSIYQSRSEKDVVKYWTAVKRTVGTKGIIYILRYDFQIQRLQHKRRGTGGKGLPGLICIIRENLYFFARIAFACEHHWTFSTIVEKMNWNAISITYSAIRYVESKALFCSLLGNTTVISFIHFPKATS